MAERKNLPSKIAAQDVVVSTAQRTSIVARGLAAVNHSKQLAPTKTNGELSAEEQYRIGIMYKSGKGASRDYEEAEKWFRLAAEQGLASAQYMLGKMYENGHSSAQDDEEAASRLAAQLGLASTQVKHGQRSHKDHGVPQDVKEAIKWYRLAADQGHPNAQSWLGLIYESGRKVPQDFEAAAKWYQLAAEYGFASAQRRLGQMCISGRGVPQNLEVAVKWFRLAADQGDADAQHALEVINELENEVGQDKLISAFRKVNVSRLDSFWTKKQEKVHEETKQFLQSTQNIINKKNELYEAYCDLKRKMETPEGKKWRSDAKEFLKKVDIDRKK